MNTPINTTEAPNPLGPYNQSVLAGNTLYISGQIGINPKSNTLITEDIALETKQVLENLSAILKAADFSLEDVVKTSIFIANMEDFNAINTVYATFFNSDKAPARECVAVKTLPKNVNIEISAIAVR